MHNATATLQKLINALDETSTLYLSLAHRTTNSQFTRELQRIAQTHQWIADDLAAQMTKAGGVPERGGSRWCRLRALQSNWRMRISPDIELAYVTQAARREAAVLRCFEAAIDNVTDTGLRCSLLVQSNRIERTYNQFDCFSVLTLEQVTQAPRAARVLVPPVRDRSELRATEHVADAFSTQGDEPYRGSPAESRHSEGTLEG